MPRKGAQFAGLGPKHTRAPPEGRRKVKGPRTEPELVEKRSTKPSTTHCFSAISDYIAPQRVRFARSFGRASFLGAKRPSELQVFECDPEKWVPVFRRDRAPAIVRQKKSYETSQRRHYRPRRPRQDHAGRSPAAAIRHLSRKPARGVARDGFQRPGARARHHHYRQGGVGAVEGYPHQHRRYAGPRRLSRRGPAHP